MAWREWTSPTLRQRRTKFRQRLPSSMMELVDDDPRQQWNLVDDVVETTWSFASSLTWTRNSIDISDSPIEYWLEQKLTWNHRRRLDSSLTLTRPSRLLYDVARANFVYCLMTKNWASSRQHEILLHCFTQQRDKGAPVENSRTSKSESFLHESRQVYLENKSSVLAMYYDINYCCIWWSNFCSYILSLSKPLV